MTQPPPEQPVRCDQCGRDRAEHHCANLTDGAFVGRYLLACPTAIFWARGYDIDGRPFKRQQG